jgi:hypothetical protein
MTNPVIPFWKLGLVLCVFGVAPALRAAEKPAEVDPSVAELAVLDADLARFERFLKQYDDPKYKGYTEEIFAVLKERAEGVHKNFDPLKCDDLRWDINMQSQRLARAMAPLDTPPPANTNQVDLAELAPSPSNKAEVTAALNALSDAIARKEAQAKATTSGREAALARLEALKKSQAALAAKFTLEGWMAAARELKKN